MDNPPDPSEYENSITKWVRNEDNFCHIMGIITLMDPKALTDPKAATECNFDNVEFRHSDGTTLLSSIEFIRLLRFIRLWKKTGWTIEQTDAAICALFPVPPFLFAEDAINSRRAVRLKRIDRPKRWPARRSHSTAPMRKRVRPSRQRCCGTATMKAPWPRPK